MNSPPHDLQAASRLSDLAPEVASTIVRVAGDIALVIGVDGVICNVAGGGLPLAAPGENWVGRSWADTVSSLNRDKALSLLDEARAQGVSRRREFNHPSLDGGEIPVSWAAVRLGNEGPLLAVGRDLRAVSAIQQRFLEAQKELEREYWQRRNAEANYRLLFQVGHDAVLVLDDENGSVLDANPAAGGLFGHSSPTWGGQPLRPYIEETLRPVFDELLVTARATGRAAEVRLRAADSGNALDVSATPFRADGQRCLLVRARRAEHSANDVPGVLDFIDQTPDAVVVTDTAGRVLWANPAFLELSQTPEESRLRGHAIADVLGDSQHQWVSLLARVRARGIVGRCNLQVRPAGAAMQMVEVSGALLAEGDQEHVGFTLRVHGAGAGSAAADGLALDVSELVAQVGHASLAELLAEASRRVEVHFIEAALSAAGGSLDMASGALRISVGSLVQRMAGLGIPLPAPAGREGLPPLVN